jgi:hypothetical protein
MIGDSARARNLRRAQDAWMEHISECPWCWPHVRAAVRARVLPELCERGVELQRVVDYRMGVSDVPPR